MPVMGSQRLHRLIASSRAPRPIGIWNALTPTEKATATRACLNGRAGDRVRRAVAEGRNFRPATVAKWSPDKIAVTMQTVAVRDSNTARALLDGLHNAGRLPMIASFLDALGVAHTEGQVEEYGNIAADRATVHAAVQAMYESHGPRRTGIYLLYLYMVGSPAGEEGVAWLRSVFEGKSVDTPVVEPPVVDGDVSGRVSVAPATGAEAELPAGSQPINTDKPEVEPDRPAPTTIPAHPDEDEEDALHPGDDSQPAVGSDPSRLRSFTTLDRLLKRAAIDVARNVADAFSEDELDDAVDELVHLTARRHQSFFHAGFRDVVLNRSIAADPPADSREGLRWYWTGAIHGWARGSRWSDIVQGFHAQSIVRGLGDGADGASFEAVLHIVKALHKTGNTDEIAKFVELRAVKDSVELFDFMLAAATRLLRAGESHRARPILALLTRVDPAHEASGDRKLERLYLDAHRRMAHCLRQEGDHVLAQKNLEDILEHERDHNIRAMLYADLGLIQGQFSELEEVFLPRRSNDMERILARLDKGAPHFRKSSEFDTEYSAHGDFCLGVLALGRQEDKAEGHLESARRHFSQKHRAYSGKLQQRTALYFGISRAILLRKLSHSANIIVEAIRAGEPFPLPFTGDLVAAFEEAHRDDLINLAEALLESDDAEALDELANSEKALTTVPILAERLFARGADEQYAGSKRARDYRLALRGFMAQYHNVPGSDLRERALESLHGLEVLAHEGAGMSEFVKLLGDPDNFDPIWSEDDAAVARARCHEAQKQYGDAANVLDPLFHQCLARATPEALHDARGILERLKEICAMDPSLSVAVERYERGLATRESSDSDVGHSELARKKIRVLVVGGAEPQARAADAVQRQIQERHPHILVRSIQTGWEPNWRRTLENIQRAMPTHDALVIMRFIPTILGEQVRQCWPGDRPWRFCWGAGRGAVVQAVIRAAHAIRD